MDKDGVHAHEHGAFLILHLQVVLPQGHAVSQGIAGQSKGTGSGWPPVPTGRWGRGGRWVFSDPALGPLWDLFGGRECSSH